MFRKLLVAQLKMLVRNRGALIAAIIFPIFFAALLGAATRITEGDTKLAVINEGRETGAQLIEALEAEKTFKVTQLSSRKDLESAFEEQKLDGAIVVPEIVPEGQVSFIFDEKNANQFPRTLDRLRSFIQKYNLKLAGGSEAVTMTVAPLRFRGTRTPFEYALPTILMFSVIFSALSFGGAQAIKYRENGVFKRLMVTPASARSFFVGEAITRSLLAVGQTLLVLIVGFVIATLDRKPEEPLLSGLPPITSLWLFLLAVMGVMVFVSLGFVAAGLSGNPDAVAGVTNLIGMALVIISGGLLQAVFPPQVRQAVEYLPIQPMLNSMLGVITSESSPIESAPLESLVLSAWVVGTFALALLLFRFRAPSKR